MIPELREPISELCSSSEGGDYVTYTASDLIYAVAP